MKKNIISLILLALYIQSAAQVTDKRLAGIDTFINRILKEWNVAGVSVTVVEKKKVLLAKGYGYKDFENKTPANENTLFFIGSCTKAFTSSLLSYPMADGSLDIDLPINNYLPELRFYNDELTRNITTRDMMCHRTGLPRHDLAWYNGKVSRDSILYTIRYFEPSAKLRQIWQYNNFMFAVQGVLAERLSKRTWDQLVKEKLFMPLGMQASNTTLEDFQKSNNISLGYREKDGQILKMNYANIYGMGPAGSISSNAKDMANWIIMWINGGKFNGKEIISSTYFNEATSSQMVVAGGIPRKDQSDMFFANYGFGWFLSNYRGHYRVEHGGNIDGFSTSTCFFPTDSIGIFVSVNQNASPVPSIIRNTIADKILALSYKDWHKSQKEAYDKSKAAGKEKLKADSSQRKWGTKPSHALAEYVGTYKNEAYGTIIIKLTKDTLIATFNGIDFKLKHYHYDYFTAIPVDEALADDEDLAMKGYFTTNIKGEIETFSLPLEPAVKDIEFKKETKTINVTKEDLEPFTGEYDLAGTMNVKVYIKGEKTLMVLVPGQPDYELLPVQENLFNLKIISGYSVRFEKDTNGKVTALYFIQPNGTFKAKRKN